MSVTIKDIARKAGVNHGAVSHVLRNDAYAQTLRQETRERIKKIAQEVGYVRNAYASATRTGTVKLIAYVTVHTPEAQGGMTVYRDISGILARATKLGYGVKIYSDEDLKKNFEDIVAHRIRYVIAASLAEEKQAFIADQCRKNALHLVWINQHYGSYPTISSDNEGAMIQAVEFLYSLGHRRIAYLYSQLTAFSAAGHYKGYLEGMEKCGLSTEGLLEGKVDYQNAGKSFLSLPPAKRPTAFVCETQGRALAAIYNIQDAGLKVPEDISVTGYGFEGGFNEILRPGITYALDNPFAVGEGAVDLVLGREREDLIRRVEGRYAVPTELRIYGSTAHPAKKSHKGKIITNKAKEQKETI